MTLNSHLVVATRNNRHEFHSRLVYKHFNNVGGQIAASVKSDEADAAVLSVLEEIFGRFRLKFRVNSSNSGQICALFGAFVAILRRFDGDDLEFGLRGRLEAVAEIAEAGSYVENARNVANLLRNER